MLLNEIDFGDHLGHRMFDLDACIHLQEIKGLRVFVVNEFDRARTFVLHAARECHRGPAYILAQRICDSRRRGFLNDLLMPPLKRQSRSP